MTDVSHQIKNQQDDQHEPETAATSDRSAVGIAPAAEEKKQNDDNNN
jgi:hypothetical protein